ncbi:hypothetical protein OXPF_10730 [Oxobacter pfennigii]|uniref:Uncharacterized protein n=1 Tax=Oxobacter pfennigii TaxID=36849 RepID=A0A0P8W9R6_9CLOT|nr:hypothetical protein [Oxobacter pfennigii]KPU45378.1 hypothetical protein OXPF_10730 [Oxobacter pfennigii]
MIRKNKLIAILVLCTISAMTIVINSYNINKRTLKASDADKIHINKVEDLNKSPIVQKMLTANDNYTFLSGIVELEEFTPIKSMTKVNISVKQPDKYIVEVFDLYDDKANTSIAVNNGKEIQLKEPDTEIKKYKPFTESNKTQADPNEGIVPDFNGTYLALSGPVNSMIHPEFYVHDAFRRSTVTVLGDDKFLDRAATVINLKYVENKGGDSQTFWVDKNTGVILKTELYDEEGEILFRDAFTK